MNQDVQCLRTEYDIPACIGTDVPTIVTDGDKIVKLTCASMHCGRVNGLPAWRADYPTTFKAGDIVFAEISSGGQFIRIINAKNRLHRELWWRGGQ